MREPTTTHWPLAMVHRFPCSLEWWFDVGYNCVNAVLKPAFGVEDERRDFFEFGFDIDVEWAMMLTRWTHMEVHMEI